MRLYMNRVTIVEIRGCFLGGVSHGCREVSLDATEITCLLFVVLLLTEVEKLLWDERLFRFFNWLVFKLNDFFNHLARLIDTMWSLEFLVHNFKIISEQVLIIVVIVINKRDVRFLHSKVRADVLLEETLLMIKTVRQTLPLVHKRPLRLAHHLIMTYLWRSFINIYWCDHSVFSPARR